MKLKTLDGRMVSRQFTGDRYGLKSRDKCKSESQYLLGQLLKRIYPGYVICEEFVIPDTRLSIDFFIPALGIIFEFDGSQHAKYNSFFHSSKKAFEAQVGRDHTKEEWCAINNFRIVRVTNKNISKEELIGLIINSNES